MIIEEQKQSQLPKEEDGWTPISGYEGYYEIHPNGSIRSLDRKIKDRYLLKGRTLKQSKENNGYLTVSLCKFGIQKTFTVHTLVARAFIPISENRNFVNHINGDKTDNRVENLEWCTRSENAKHAIRIGLAKPACFYFKPKLTAEKVLEIRELKRLGVKQVDIARKIGVSTSTVSTVLLGKSWRHVT